MILFLKNLLFTVAVPGVTAVLVPLWLAPAERAQGPIVFAGLLLLALGGLIYLWCLWDFATFGRGTPAPIDAPKRLVVRGLYRYSRNPMYVGVLTVILGWSLVYAALRLLLYLAALGTVFHLFILLYEEPHLRRVFGAEYERYRERVGRWLPKIS